MYEESELSYFKGGLAVGIGLGLLSGQLQRFGIIAKVLSADQVLENIKTSFKEGAIEGAWISLKRTIRKFAVRSSAYRGGLSRIEDGETVYYEFQQMLIQEPYQTFQEKAQQINTSKMK